MGRSPDMPSRKASLLKKQKGVCSWCCLHFREGDLLETDHNIPRALGVVTLTSTLIASTGRSSTKLYISCLTI